MRATVACAGTPGFAGDRRGVVAVEFALLAPALILLLLVVFELSRVHYVQNTLQSAAAVVLRQATIDRELGEAAARSALLRELVGVDPGAVQAFTLSRAEHGPDNLQRITVEVELVLALVLPLPFDRTIRIRAERQGFAIG